MRKYKIVFIVLVTLLSGCALKKMKAFSECAFRLDKVNSIKVADVNINPNGKTNISMPEALQLAAALSQKKLPVTLDLNIEGQNPNTIEAKMIKFDWKIKVKGDEIIDGVVNNVMTIAPQSTATVGFQTKFDLYPTVTNYSMEEVRDILNNVFDEEGNPKDIKILIRPYISVGKVNIPYPTFIDISKSYKSK